MKRTYSILLALALILALALPAAAAENTASTMRLMETEGTVSTKNSVGTALTIRDGMRLYSGYKVSTEAASYAYVALDNNKTAKLDASSSAKVSQSGKQLELNLTAGSLFFNVPVALKSGERMQVRTSTMVTGIRGTAGYVKEVDRYTTRVALLEGAATIYSRDPLTGANRSVTITGGQVATIILHERAASMTQQLINQGVIIEENIVDSLTKLGQVVEELQEDDVPGFVAEEVAKDSDLQQRIANESPLNPAEIARNAAEKRAADEQDAADKALDIQDQLKDTKAKDTPKDEDKVFTEPETIVVTETNTVTEALLDTDNPAESEVQKSLTDTNTATATNANLALGANLAVGSGQTLNIVSGTLSNPGTSRVGGTISLFDEAEMVNTGTLTVNSTNSIHIYGEFTNEGTLIIGGDDGSGRVVVHEGGTLVNNGTIEIADSGSTLEVEAGGLLENEDTMDYESGKLIIEGEYTDTVNEVYAQGSNGTVTYLGSFLDVAGDPHAYTGETFKVLNTKYLTMYDMWYCSAEDEITLDLNGNHATLVCEYDGGVDNAFYMVIDEGYPDGNTANLTLTDSVGGGSLTCEIYLRQDFCFAMDSGTLIGYVDSMENSIFQMSGGTIEVPEGCAGVCVEDGFFHMAGGTIDATADDSCAIDVYYYNCALEHGILLGQHLVPNSIYGYLSFAEAYIPEYDYYDSFDFPSNYWICLSGNSSEFPILLCYETDTSGIFRSNLVTLYAGGEE